MERTFPANKHITHWVDFEENVYTFPDGCFCFLALNFCFEKYLPFTLYLRAKSFSLNFSWFSRRMHNFRVVVAFPASTLALTVRSNACWFFCLSLLGWCTYAVALLQVINHLSSRSIQANDCKKQEHQGKCCSIPTLSWVCFQYSTKLHRCCIRTHNSSKHSYFGDSGKLALQAWKTKLSANNCKCSLLPSSPYFTPRQRIQATIIFNSILCGQWREYFSISSREWLAGPLNRAMCFLSKTTNWEPTDGFKLATLLFGPYSFWEITFHIHQENPFSKLLLKKYQMIMQLLNDKFSVEL